MHNKKKHRYQAGGIVEQLMNSDSIITKDQSTQNKITRDLGRREISKPPRMNGDSPYGGHLLSPIERMIKSRSLRPRFADDIPPNIEKHLGNILGAAKRVPSDIISSGVKLGQRLIPGGEEPSWREILVGNARLPSPIKRGIDALRNSRPWEALQKPEMPGVMRAASGGVIPGYQFGGQFGGGGGGQWGGGAPGGGGGQWGGGAPGGFGTEPRREGRPPQPQWGGGGGGMNQPMGGPPGGGGWGSSKGLDPSKEFGPAVPAGGGMQQQPPRPPQPQWGGGPQQQQQFEPAGGSFTQLGAGPRPGFGPQAPGGPPGGGQGRPPPGGQWGGYTPMQGGQGAQGAQGAPPTMDGGDGGGQPPAGQPPAGQPPAFQPYQAQALSPNYGGPATFKGYGGPEQMAVTQSFVAPEVASQYADLTQSIMNIGTRPYEQYQGPQLAAFTPAEAAAQAAYTAIGTGQGPQGTLQAQSTLDQAAQSTANLAPQQAQVGRKFGAYAPLAQQQAQAGAAGMQATGAQAGSPELQREADLEAYQSQFIEGAIDPKIRAVREEAARQRSELGSQAAQAGAFGSYRHGLGEQAAGQAATQQIADITGEGYQKAFESSQQAFQADRAAQQAGLQQQQQAQEAAGQLQQQGFGTMGELFGGEQRALGAQAATAAQMAGIGGQQLQLGQQQQQQMSQRLGEMQKAGASQRELQQAAIDIRRQQWEQQRQHPERQAQWTSQMLGSLPYQNVQQQARYTPQGGPLASAIGSGISGLGLWNQFQSNQQGAPPGWKFEGGQWVQDQGTDVTKPPMPLG